jgi:hypothetical protein
MNDAVSWSCSSVASVASLAASFPRGLSRVPATGFPRAIPRIVSDYNCEILSRSESPGGKGTRSRRVIEGGRLGRTAKKKLGHSTLLVEMSSAVDKSFYRF